MVKALVEVDAGVCGFTTRIEAWSKDGDRVGLRIESDCANVRILGEELSEVDPMAVLFGGAKDALALSAADRQPLHRACAVPTGIFKAVEVAAGLALPGDVAIKVRRGE